MAVHSREVTLPRYRSHKEVEAVKIAAIEFDIGGAAKIAAKSAIVYPVFTTKPGFRDRFKGGEDDLGYYVRYADGYESWSPSKAFEEGYTKVTP